MNIVTCLFKLYAEYIMRNAGLKETQAGIKIAGRAQTVKRLPAVQETRVQSLHREDPVERKWQPTPVLLPGKFHGQRSLVGYI